MLLLFYLKHSLTNQGGFMSRVLLVIPFIFCFQMTAFADSSVVVAPTDHVFVPKGFDNNDSVEVVVTGNFSSSCYSRNITKVNVSGTQIDISVDAIEKRDKEGSESLCALMLVPFKDVVSIGLLPAGLYTITVNKGTQYEVVNTLMVEKTESSLTDDYTYLDVLYIEQLEVANRYKVKGMRYSPCLELDRFEAISNNKDTISVLPIMKKVSDFCPMKMTPVVYETEIDTSGLPASKILLHVRTMDGKSVNTLIQKD